MTNEDYIDGRLSQIRCQHTGKAPFGPLHDLQRLYDDLPETDRPAFWAALEARRSDSFWSWFIETFIRQTEPSRL